MSAFLKIGVGAAAFAVGWCYLYKWEWVLRANAWCRDVVVNDAAVANVRRQVGLFCVVVASLAFYSGFTGLNSSITVGPRIEREMFSEAQRAFQDRHYAGAVARCQTLIRIKPDNVPTWELLGSSWLALGKATEARKAWMRVLQLDPKNSVRNSRIIREPKAAEEMEAAQAAESPASHE